MKKNYFNFFLLTLLISVIGTAVLALIETIIGSSALFICAWAFVCGAGLWLVLNNNFKTK